MSNSVATLRRVELLKGRLQGVTDRLGQQAIDTGTPTLATVVHFRHPTPQVAVELRTCRVDAEGRIKLPDAVARLGWSVGTLSASADGPWVILHPAPGGASAHLHSPRIDTAGRISLPRALPVQLGAKSGATLPVTSIPSQDAVALINPATVLLAAPLALLD